MAEADAGSALPENAQMPSTSSQPAGVVKLDDVRDFLYTSLRSIERFADELRKTVEELQQRQPSEEWLDQGQGQLTRGALFLGQQQGLWAGFNKRMDDYVASVRAAAEDMALKEMSLSGSGQQQEGEGPSENQARFIHPELHRFKLEKQAKIIGKYGGSPAFGGMVMPRLAKEAAILKATASPAAREIQYSKAENKDAQYLAHVMQFKVEKKEKQLEGWQGEMSEKKGSRYLEEQQAKGVRQEAVTPTHVPVDLAAKLAQRQATMAAAEEAEAAAASKAKLAEQAEKLVSGELGAKLASRQAAAAAAAAEAAAAEKAAQQEAAEAAGEGAQESNPLHTPLVAELSAALKQRKTTAPATPTPATPTPAAANNGASQTPAPTPVAGANGDSSMGGASSSTAPVTPSPAGGITFPRMNKVPSSSTPPQRAAPTPEPESELMRRFKQMSNKSDS